MWLIDELAERRIAEARDRGELAGLRGEGKPVELDDERLVPEHLRVGFRLLKNAGYLPPQLQTLRELREAEDLLACLPASERAARDRAKRRLDLLRQRLQQQGGRDRGPLWVTEGQYGSRILQRLGGDDDKQS